MVTEVIEGEVVEEPRTEEPRALAVVMDQGMAASGPLALAGLTDEEFDRRLAALDTMRTRVARMQKALMVVDVDYGVIPGTGSKPTLLKPGAEKLCQAYGLAADFQPKRTTGDGETVPHLSYVTRCELHLGSLDGLTIAVGYGAANSWERKHRWRRGERVCPACGQPAIIKGREEYGGGWVCFKKKGGCGSKWPDGATEIEGQSVGDVENPDPFDLDVVLAKMSEKRAFIDATLRATAASGLFTQDIEDLGRPPDDARATEPAAQSADGSLIGTVEKGKAPVDLELRQDAERGPIAGFKLAQGRTGLQVLASGNLADVLQPLLGALVGQRVSVWGSVEMVPWNKKGDDGKPIPMPPFKRLNLSKIQTAEWILPGNVIAAQEAGPEPAEPDGLPLEAESAALFADDDLSDLQGF